jgi:hypothetical protein
MPFWCFGPPRPSSSLAASDTISFVLFTERNYQREGKARVEIPTGFFSTVKDASRW